MSGVGVINLIIFLAIGIIAGLLASNMMKNKGFGHIGNIIVGIIGAVVGGYIFSVSGIIIVSMIGSIITASLGAIILLFILSLFKN